MSAYKIILKRSSILGKRPNNQLLEAGEIALNTNSVDPGLFFETNAGSIIKAGPTSYLPNPPVTFPSQGELWVNSNTNQLSVGSSDNIWESVSTPFLGGTNGYSVFVAPEYSQATDALENDGQTLPFRTLNRAIIEVGKRIVQDSLNKITTNIKYTIFLAPSATTVYNGKGVTPANFTVNFAPGATQSNPNIDVLQEFNHPLGGLIIPRGVSIVGLDLKKSILRPAYIPTYSHVGFPENYQLDPRGPRYTAQPRSHVLRWSGNTYFNNFTVTDKSDQRVVTSIIPGDPQTNALAEEIALFVTSTPHGLDIDDYVQIRAESFTQNSPNFSNGAYYVQPITPFSFIVSRISVVINNKEPNSEVIRISDLNPQLVQQPNTNLFTVQNIYPYFQPLSNESYEVGLYSAHRLSVFGNATEGDLNDFYVKIQKAFPDIFGKTVNFSLVAAPEYQIVAGTDDPYPQNFNSNSALNTSPYVNQVILRSSYGMAMCDINGEIVRGFRSSIFNSSTAVTLQRDPACYELYTTQNNVSQWAPLTKLVADSLDKEITNVPRLDQLLYLNSASLTDVRFMYSTLQATNPEGRPLGDSGLTDIDNDFRHFGFRARGTNTFLQAQSISTIGAAVGVWAMNGAEISLKSSTTNFGFTAFQAEGFSGIGTLGGAKSGNQGFLQAGVVRPLALTAAQVSSDDQKKVLSLSSYIVSIEIDPKDADVQLIKLSDQFKPATILPYSLSPGSALYVKQGNNIYRGFFVTDGSPTTIQVDPETNKGVLRIRAWDSTLPNFTKAPELTIPFIRRFVDPRQPIDRAYGFYVESTNPVSRAPQSGYILRLNQTGQQLSNTLKRNYQFDPGAYGGISQVFKVDEVITDFAIDSGNYNHKIYDAAQSPAYALYASLVDNGYPWLQVKVDSEDAFERVIDQPEGSHTSYQNRNYYCSENNESPVLYYKTNYSSTNGPFKVSPDQRESPYVATATTLKQTPIADVYQGLVPDPLYKSYEKLSESAYFRGATTPYTEIYGQNNYDGDDGSDSTGIIYTRQDTATSTNLTADSVVVQKLIPPSIPPFDENSTFGAPEILELKVATMSGIVNPKTNLSVVKVTDGESVEYMRVVLLGVNSLYAIRNYYPGYRIGDLKKLWETGSAVVVCQETNSPEISEYDPNWSVTKQTVLRYYELMGYPTSQMVKYFVPQYHGDRIFTNDRLPLAPENGYAQSTSPWPIEFNLPSAIFADNHSWQYCGYLDYSRGLPKYQVNEFSRKVQYDFLSTSHWGGYLNIIGHTDARETVILGSIKQAVTGNFYQNTNVETSSSLMSSIQSLTQKFLPNPVFVYPVDPITRQFNGNKKVFLLARDGVTIPSDILNSTSMIVTMDGKVLKPQRDYTVTNSNVVFAKAPEAGSVSHIRVFTSEDEQISLQMCSAQKKGDFDGSLSTFEIEMNSYLELNQPSKETAMVFVGGKLLNYGEDYTFGENDSNEPVIMFSNAPDKADTFDMRVLTKNYSPRKSTIIPQSVVLDDISSMMNGVQTMFPLKLNESDVNPNVVGETNLVVSFNGEVQDPFTHELQPTGYEVNGSNIMFEVPPPVGTECIIRLITNNQNLTLRG